MKNVFILFFVAAALFSCSSSEVESQKEYADVMINIHSEILTEVDSIVNVVKEYNSTHPDNMVGVPLDDIELNKKLFETFAEKFKNQAKKSGKEAFEESERNFNDVVNNLQRLQRETDLRYHEAIGDLDEYITAQHEKTVKDLEERDKARLKTPTK